MQWREWPPQGAQLFRALRTPGVGEQLALEENQFLARSLENGVKRRLSETERAAYYAPYPTPAARRPLLQWPREIPIEGEPADVLAVVERYDSWLAHSPSTPKLLLSFESATPLGSTAMLKWAEQHIGALAIEALGPAGHHAPEDAPHAIGQSLRRWLERRVA
jgi:haloalkane dehalogenase